MFNSCIRVFPTPPTLLTFTVNQLALWTRDGYLKFDLYFHRAEALVVMWANRFTIELNHIGAKFNTFLVVYKNVNLRLTIKSLKTLKLHVAFTTEARQCSKLHYFLIFGPKLRSLENFHGLMESHAKLQRLRRDHRVEHVTVSPVPPTTTTTKRAPFGRMQTVDELVIDIVFYCPLIHLTPYSVDRVRFSSPRRSSGRSRIASAARVRRSARAGVAVTRCRAWKVVAQSLPSPNQRRTPPITPITNTINTKSIILLPQIVLVARPI